MFDSARLQLARHLGSWRLRSSPISLKPTLQLVHRYRIYQFEFYETAPSICEVLARGQTAADLFGMV
jgi:hypothetical protein